MKFNFHNFLAFSAKTILKLGEEISVKSSHKN